MTRHWHCPKCGWQLQTHPAVTHAAHPCTPHTRRLTPLTPDPPDPPEAA